MGGYVIPQLPTRETLSEKDNFRAQIGKLISYARTMTSLRFMPTRPEQLILYASHCSTQTCAGHISSCLCHKFLHKHCVKQRTLQCWRWCAKHAPMFTGTILSNYTQKTDMTMENQRLEDVFPLKHGDFPLSC